MNAKVIVIENFLADADAERARALEAAYGPAMQSGIQYQGIAPTESPEQEDAIRARLALPGGKFTTFWRRYVAPELRTDDPKRWKLIHVDSEMGDVAGVLFLTPPESCRGGLAFWRHKAYGFVTVPTTDDMAARGLKDDARFWENIRIDGEDPSHWEMWDYVPMAFNRMVLFSAHLFHSKWPEHALAENFEESRLIKAFFWRPE